MPTNKFLWIIALFGLSCSGIEQPALLNIQVQEYMDVRSVQTNQAGDIICFGIHPESNDYLLHQYSNDLRLERVINLSEMTQLNGHLNVRLLENRQFLISSVETGTTSEIKVFSTNWDLEIEQKNTLRFSSDSNFKAVVRQIEQLQNGDYLVLTDTTSRVSITNFGGFKFYRLDKELNILHSFSESVEERSSCYAPLAIENPSGKIHFAIGCRMASGDGPFSTLQVGVLEKDLSLVSSNLVNFNNTRDLLDPISLLGDGTDIHLHSRVNKQRLTYSTIDPMTAAILSENTLPISELNFEQDISYFENTFPFISEHFLTGSSNGMVKLMSGNFGQFVYSLFNKELYLRISNSEGEIQTSEGVILPQFDKLSSFRQTVDREGNIILAVSYTYENENFLTLFKLNEKAELI